MHHFYLTILALLSTVAGNNVLERFQERTEGNCKTIMDLFIVLDSSGSVGAGHFQKAKEALVDLVSLLEIGPKHVQVWVVNYGDTVETPVIFHNMPIMELTKEKLKARIRAIPYLSGSCTATGDALSRVRQICDKFCRGFHEGVSRVALVLTDGYSNCGSNVATQSTTLGHITKASVFAVGIGERINNAELLTIATDKNYVMHINNYLSLTTAINNITIQTCGIPAFVIINTKVTTEVSGNNYRFYQLDTEELLRQRVNNKGGFVEVVAHLIEGGVEIYTSTTNKNPQSGTGRRVEFQTRGSEQYYIEYIEQNTSRLYISFYGLQARNQYDFVVHWLDMTGAVIG